MSEPDNMFYCSFVSIHYIICECGETFPTEEELKTHLDRDHAQKKERKEYKCGVCERIYSTEQACIEHYEASHIEIKNEHEYEQEQEYEQEEEYQEQEYQEQEYKQEQDYHEDHEYAADHDYVETVQEEVEGEPDEEVTYMEVLVSDGSDQLQSVRVQKQIEPICIQKNIDSVNIKKEIDSVRIKKEKKPKSYYNIKNIVCEVCGKRYASNAALKYHQRVHTGERPYKCTECSKSFTMPLFLQIHMRTHTGERPYECSLCPKAFSNKAALLRHDRVHTGIKPYECATCGKFFTQSNSMKLHVKTVHLKQPAPYKSKNRMNKAKERERLRDSILTVISNEGTEVVESIVPETQNLEEAIFIKPEVDLYQQEVEESEILYEDVDSSNQVTYEVVYEA